MHDLLFCTHCFGQYADYIPIYAFTALRAYPDSFVKIHCSESLSPGTVSSLAMIRGNLSDRFEIIEESPPFHERVHPDARNAIRFLLGKECFEGFRYGYTADIDAIVIRESPSLMEQEIQQSRLIGKCYSSVVRETPGFTNKMAGWFFFEVEPYFEKVQPLIESLRSDLDSLQGGSTLPGDDGHGFDENILYRLVKPSHGLLEASEDRPFRWTLDHGFHLGIHRTHRPYPSWWLKNPSWRSEGLSILRDSTFRGIRENLPGWIAEQVDDLEGFLKYGIQGEKQAIASLMNR